jgi:hypothetical protein
MAENKFFRIYRRCYSSTILSDVDPNLCPASQRRFTLQLRICPTPSFAIWTWRVAVLILSDPTPCRSAPRAYIDRKQCGDELGDSSVQNHFGTYRESCMYVAAFTQLDRQSPPAAKSLRTPSSQLFLAIPSSSRYRNCRRRTASRWPSLWRSTRDGQPIADWPR